MLFMSTCFYVYSSLEAYLPVVLFSMRLYASFGIKRSPTPSLQSAEGLEIKKHHRLKWTRFFLQTSLTSGWWFQPI